MSVELPMANLVEDLVITSIQPSEWETLVNLVNTKEDIPKKKNLRRMGKYQSELRLLTRGEVVPPTLLYESFVLDY